VSKTKELKKRYEAKRESSRQFWKASPVRAALLSARRRSCAARELTVEVDWVRVGTGAHDVRDRDGWRGAVAREDPQVRALPLGMQTTSPRCVLGRYLVDLYTLVTAHSQASG